MLLKPIINYFPVIIKYPMSILQEKEYVLIIGHMRSYSSLLSHILGSHKAIDGYSELHYSYSNQFDSIKAKIQVMDTLGTKLNGKYLLDKLLHNANQISDKFLQNNSVKLILLLRNPEDTYKSRLNLRKRHNKQEQDLLIMHKYYLDRINMLKKLAKSLNTNKIFIESEHIVNNTDKTLIKLQEFLELDSPLAKNYQQFKYTGDGSYGDSSAMLKKGEISVNLRKYKNINISNKILEEALVSYNNCKENLIRYCK